MRFILRSLMRRRFRTSLTVFGVTVGIFGFVIMGALAERMNLYARNAMAYYERFIWVVSENTLFGMGSILDTSLQPELEAIDGVAFATPRVFAPVDVDDMASPLTMCWVLGTDLAPDRSQLRMFETQAGDFLPEGSSGLVLLGDVAARKYEKRVGDPIGIRDETFTVHGIIEPTYTDPDYLVCMSVDDARRVLGFPEDKTSVYAVRADHGFDASNLAREIDERVDGIQTLPPEEIGQQMSSFMSLINSLVFGATIVAVLAGSLGIVNTMIMAVTERAREIATKKAIGAGTHQVFTEFVAESVVISIIGGIVGIGLGHLAANLLNGYLGDDGTRLFAVTVRLMGWAMVVAVVVGCLAGVYPALRAARVDPVRVLRNL